MFSTSSKAKIYFGEEFGHRRVFRHCMYGRPRGKYREAGVSDRPMNKEDVQFSVWSAGEEVFLTVSEKQPPDFAATHELGIHRDYSREKAVV